VQSRRCKTVRRYAHAATPEDASLGIGSRRYGQIHAYSSYLYRRWNEGCTDAARLHAEITELGYLGSKRTVRRHLEQIRASGKPALEKPKELTQGRPRRGRKRRRSHRHLSRRAIAASSNAAATPKPWSPSPARYSSSPGT
jgi:hypothetical protein